MFLIYYFIFFYMDLSSALYQSAVDAVQSGLDSFMVDQRGQGVNRSHVRYLINLYIH